MSWSSQHYNIVKNIIKKDLYNVFIGLAINFNSISNKIFN